MTDIQLRVLKVLRPLKKGMYPKELAKKLSVRKTRREEYRLAIQELLEENKIIEYKGRYYLPEHLGLVRAEIVKVNGTFGFAKNLDTQKEIFIPGRDLQGGLPGDLVLLKQFKGTGQLPEGKVFQVLSAADNPFSGVLAMEGAVLCVVPDKYVRFPIAIRGVGKGAQPGDKVVARIVRRGRRHSEHVAELVENFGSASAASACCRAILEAAGIRLEFPPEVLEQARAIAAGDGIHPKELAARTDLRDQPIFTIDGADSKDLDDAVHIARRPDGGWELGVHIADVSYYVTHKSPLDEEAFARGTSVYYADSVIPMLPPELSNGICSLNPGEDRLAFSALLTLDSGGEMTSYRFAKTVIRSRVKGVYTEVNAILAGSADEALLGKYRGLVESISLMKELADILTANRYRRGGMDLESVESKIVIGENGKAIDVHPRQRGDSERIIEEFMLMANQAAATRALAKELPFVYRVHEDPAADRLETLALVLEKLGIAYERKKGAVSPGQLGDLLKKVKGSDLAPILNTLVLRSMAKAKYSDSNIGHFGLALKNYAHFTSPIRRYPDLTIHRILSGQVTGMRPENIHKRFDSFVRHSALQSTQREIAAMTAERDCEDCYKAEYMEQFIDEDFDGVITSVTAFGFYVQLPNTVEGLVAQRNFPLGDWDFDGSISFQERATGRRFRLGDSVRVRVASVNVSAGQVDFLLSEAAQEKEEGHDAV